MITLSTYIHCTVPPKHNVALAREQVFAHIEKSLIKGGAAPILLASIHPAINRVNTCEQIGCRTPLIGNYSSASKCLLVRECGGEYG